MEWDEASRRLDEAQRDLVTQASDFSLDTIATLIKRGALDPTPSHQRRQRWDAARQSALIESFLLNIPVPPIYLSEDDYGVYSIIDGRERVYAIGEFMSGRLALRALPILHEFEGKTILDLPEQAVMALRVRPHLRAVTLLRQSNPALKYEVFIRLNTGGQALTEQEVRNVVYAGPLNDLLFELAAKPFFRHQLNLTGKSARYHRMQDVEYVLRFLSLAESGNRFYGSISSFMNYFMAEHREASAENIVRYRRMFLRALAGCEAIWGERAFRRFRHGRWLNGLSLAVYDGQMLAVNHVSDHVLEIAARNSDAIVGATEALFESRGLDQVLSDSIYSPGSVERRTDAFIDLLTRQ